MVPSETGSVTRCPAQGLHAAWQTPSVSEPKDRAERLQGDKSTDDLPSAVSKLAPHPTALWERVQVQQKYSGATQLIVLCIAWATVDAACDSDAMSSLKHERTCSNGDLYSCVEDLSGVLGIALAGSFYDSTRSKCRQILACDVTGSGWMLSPPDPSDRAEQRLP